MEGTEALVVVVNLRQLVKILLECPLRLLDADHDFRGQVVATSKSPGVVAAAQLQHGPFALVAVLIEP